MQVGWREKRVGMAATKVGSRIVVRGAAGPPLTLRALRAIELEGGWAVPVMADLTAIFNAGLDSGQVEIEVSTDRGTVCLDAEIVHSDGNFVVRAPGLRTAAVTEQRRENVRASLALSVRGTVLSTRGGPAGAEPVTRHDSPAGPRQVLDGLTRTVSAGGLCVVFGALPSGAQQGARLYLELTMPGGELAPAVVSVVERAPVKDGVLARLRFLDISPLDSERLVRMVFARQRADLAERRGTPRPRQLPH
jgi:hypothetical protein